MMSVTVRKQFLQMPSNVLQTIMDLSPKPAIQGKEMKKGMLKIR
jgi:hypothetical protein